MPPPQHGSASATSVSCMFLCEQMMMTMMTAVAVTEYGPSSVARAHGRGTAAVVHLPRSCRRSRARAHSAGHSTNSPAHDTHRCALSWPLNELTCAFARHAQVCTQRTHLRTTRTGAHVVRERIRPDERVTSRTAYVTLHSQQPTCGRAVKPCLQRAG